MAFLTRVKKVDLCALAEELGEELSPGLLVPELKSMILNSENYEEESVKGLLERITEDRLEREREEREEREREREIEREREERKRELEREERKRELEREEREREREERERERAYELEKLRLGLGSERNSETSEGSRDRVHKIDTQLQKLVPKFEPEKSDISLYLVIFERQANRANIEKNDWVSILLGLLPLDIVQLIARETDEDAENYDHVKKLLLKRFKLSPEVFRQKFVHHQKRGEGTWKDFAFETKNYFEEWIAGLKIDDFNGLKELMIVDQIKKRVDPEVKEFYLEKWADLVSVSELTQLLDNHEEVRKNFRKPVRSERVQNSRENASFSKGEKLNTRFPEKSNFRSNFHSKQVESYNSNFERRKKPRCFECGSEGHFRNTCPKLIQENVEKTENVNHLVVSEQPEFLLPYIKEGSVNGHKILFLRDSGSTLDVVSRKYVSPDSFCGENIWVKQPLDIHPICLPLAMVQLKGEFGTIKTKAGVCEKTLDEGRYILGNRTAALIEKTTGYDFKVECSNAVVTRSQEKLMKEKSNLGPAQNELTTPDPEVIRTEGDCNSDKGIVIPEAEEGAPVLMFPNVSANEVLRGGVQPRGAKGKPGSRIPGRETEHEGTPLRGGRSEDVCKRLVRGSQTQEIKRRKKKFGPANARKCFLERLGGDNGKLEAKQIRRFDQLKRERKTGSCRERGKRNKPPYKVNCHEENRELFRQKEKGRGRKIGRLIRAKFLRKKLLSRVGSNREVEKTRGGNRDKFRRARSDVHGFRGNSKGLRGRCSEFGVTENIKIRATADIGGTEFPYEVQ